MTGGWPIHHEPDFRLDSVDAAVSEVEGFLTAGGAAIVEMTPLGFGRDPDGLRTIAQRTGVTIVGCTGFHKLSYYAGNHWLHRYSVEQIADLLAAEVTEGMDRHGLDGPFVERSEARAGVVKLAKRSARSTAAPARPFPRTPTRAPSDTSNSTCSARRESLRTLSSSATSITTPTRVT
jgi:phosphotriesterase-related protein